jgi:hypothetical protein
VCDREKLIKLLLANPDRLRAWANALGIDATPKAVADYIRKLRPVTLTRDTQVTNHSFLDGDAQPYQAILQKGTAVLVDQTGKPVTRCRCGNPLSEPVKLSGTVKCIDCPPAYRPPPPCNYTDEKGDCYAKQPEAPPVKGEEKPSDTTDCEHDPSSPGCADKCKQDPSLPFCDHENQNQSQEQQAPQGGQGTTSGGEQAPSQGGGTPPESGGTPSEGGGGAGGP